MDTVRPLVGALRRAAWLLALSMASAMAFANHAPPAEVAAELPGARHQGSGRLTFFGLPVYDARLWVGEAFSADRFELAPLAIEIEYRRALDGQRIAERSLQEMRRAGRLSEVQAERWLAAMAQTFPDVVEGDRITGVHRPGEPTRFFVNGRARGEVRDAEFARRFFGIWLAPTTSEPKLREALLGGVDAAARARP